MADLHGASLDNIIHHCAERIIYQLLVPLSMFSVVEFYWAGYTGTPHGGNIKDSTSTERHCQYAGATIVCSLARVLFVLVPGVSKNLYSLWL